MSATKAQHAASIHGKSAIQHRPVFVQRKCACGNSTNPLADSCESCSARSIQKKLSLGSTSDPLEAEADRVADQVTMGASTDHSGVAHAAAGLPPVIRRLTTQPHNDVDVPPSVERVLSKSGAALENGLREDMEQKMGHDFSLVRIHTGADAAASARQIAALAYTAGSDIVFGEGQFSPETMQGKRLLAHELTHVVQQNGAVGAASVRRKPGAGGMAWAPSDLFVAYFADMTFGRFDGISRQLYLGFMAHPEPENYLQDVFMYASSKLDDFEDSLAASFVERLKETQLDALAKTREGRYALSLMYVAMITGDVSEFEREQANRVLFAKVRIRSADEFAEETQSRNGEGKLPVRIFPVRFMRVFGGDYAPPLATLKPNGMVHVSYPQNMASMDMFAKERKTIWSFIGHGDDIQANEIVIIKDYEQNTETPLPAIALVDYSNQAIHSTWGKIVEVSMIAATLGWGAGGAAAAETGEAAAARITATAIWGARLARAATYIDDVANVISLASLAIKENREWLEKKLGWFGRGLVIAAEVSDTALAIYGVGRLAQTGYKFVKKFYTAAKEARAAAKGLTQSQTSVLEEVEDKLGKLSRELDNAAAERKAASSRPKDEPTPRSSEGGAKPAERPKSSERNRFGTSFERASTATTDALAQSVRQTAKEAGSEIQIGKQTHAVAPSTVGKEIGFQLCTHCSLLSKKLVALEEIIPAESELAREVAFMRKKAEGLDEAFKKASKGKPFTPAMEKQAAKGLADDLKKNVAKDQFVEELLNMDLEDLKKNRAKLKKQAAANPVLNDTQAARDARTAAVEKNNLASAKENERRMKGRVEAKSAKEVDKAIDESVSSTAGKTSNSTAPKDHPTKQDLSNNIDENKAVGERNSGHMPGGRDVDRAERVERALSMENRDFKEAVTNQKSKKEWTEFPIGKSSVPGKPVSLKDDYGALMGRKFSEIEEVNAIGKRIRKDMEAKGIDKIKPTALKKEMNSRLWDEFKYPKSKEGEIVAEAIERNGMGLVEVGDKFVLRHLSKNEMTRRGFKFIEGEGWIRPLGIGK